MDLGPSIPGPSTVDIPILEPEPLSVSASVSVSVSLFDHGEGDGGGEGGEGDENWSEEGGRTAGDPISSFSFASMFCDILTKKRVEIAE